MESQSGLAKVQPFRDRIPASYLMRDRPIPKNKFRANIVYNHIKTYNQMNQA